MVKTGVFPLIYPPHTGYGNPAAGFVEFNFIRAGVDQWKSYVPEMFGIFR
jgi:hypothetical protein